MKTPSAFPGPARGSGTAGERRLASRFRPHFADELIE